MAYKTYCASPGGVLQANRAAILAVINTQLLAMGWTSVDDSGLATVSKYGNLVASSAITTGTPGTITLSGHGYVLNQMVIYTTSGTKAGGLTPTQVCASAAITNVGGNINVNINTHGFVADQAVLYSPAGAAAGNLTAGQVYYIRYTDANNFGLATAPGGGAIAYSSAGTGNHTWGSIYFICNPLTNTFQLAITSGGGAIAISSQGTGNHSFGPADLTNYWFLAPGHGYSVGNNLNYSTAGGLMTPLNNNITGMGPPGYLGYWIVAASTDAFKVSTSSGGAAVVIQVQGSGLHIWSQCYRVYSSAGESADFSAAPNATHYLIISWQAANVIAFSLCYHWNATTHYAYGVVFNAMANYTITTTELNTTYFWMWGSQTWVVFVAKIATTYYTLQLGFLKKFFSAQTTTTGAVSSGSNVTVTVADPSQLVASKYYQIMGVAGEGRDRIQVTLISGSTITIASLPRNYGSGAIIGETPTTMIMYSNSVSAWQQVNPLTAVGLGNAAASTETFGVPFSTSYLNPDGRAEQRALLQPLFLISIISPYGVSGYLDDYYMNGPAASASAVNEDIFGVGPQELTVAGKGIFSGTSIGTGNDGTHFNDTRTYSGDAINWTNDHWAGYELIITGGTGAGQSRAIASNGATQLVITTAFTTTPDSTSTYAICQEAWRFFNNYVVKENL